MLRIWADAHNDAVPADDLALIADRFDAWSHFHNVLLLIQFQFLNRNVMRPRVKS